ncbi:SdiA-regulated domain-containing protein [Lutibacter sp.]|uniref:SdiA-regulated domain-containing protein n=1 Tax=Lutibacter sp. TaxID=1925666 RepID=UPI003569DA4C
MKFKTIALFIFVSFLSCGNVSEVKKLLEPIAKVKLKISEPSGIAFYNNHLYIVSDRKYFIYKTNLHGKVVGEIATNLTGLEGITVDNFGNFVVVDEVKRTLIKVDAGGNRLFKTKIKGKQKDKNSGLEGVCFNSKNNSYYLLNEKSPKELIRVSEEGEVLKTIKISFAKDLAGICYDAKANVFWLVSDESESIYKINEKGKLLGSYKIPVKKPEGIVVVNDLIYVVSDSESKMYTFKKPS